MGKHLDDSCRQSIFDEFMSGKVSIRVLATEFGVSKKTVSSIIDEKRIQQKITKNKFQ